MVKKAVIAVMVLSFVFPFGAVYADRVGGGDLTFNPKGAKPVIFSHEKHVAGKGLKCTGCHYHVFQMTQGSYKMEMNKITKGDFCGKCHNGGKSFDVKDSKNCDKCHK